MAIGWLPNLASGTTYFQTERLYYSFWTGLADDAARTRSIIHAYNRLYYGNEFVLPTYAEASADQLVVLRIANCEMAYYIAQHIRDEDRRKNIQAQGVITAGIVKESYLEDMIKNTPVPPFVRDMLFAAGFKKRKFFKVVALERDENKDLRK